MNGRRLDIGIASFKSADKLRKTINLIRRHSVTDWRLIIVHNQDGSPENEAAFNVALDAHAEDGRITFLAQTNIGYAGAVNRLLSTAETEYIAYVDNDAYVSTPAWDETLCSYLDRFHEIGMIFPGSGVYPIPRSQGYSEVMWAPGFCWILNRMCMRETGEFDAEIGHQEEADYCMRVRMAGYRCAAVPEVYVEHDATSTTDPGSIERINAGVVKWVNKWNRYFNGKNFNYHSPNVTRWEDWPPNALYFEEYWKGRLPGLNDHPEKVTLDGRAYDLIRVPRLAGFYTGRII
jgi:GT2 family glycosyltransferase